MSKTVKGVMVTRLIVLLAIILVPISIFLIFTLVDFQLWYSNDPILQFWIIKFLCPFVFSISWLFFLVLFANRFAVTMDSFDEKISVVPSRLKFFYGINAMYLLLIFVFPIITPLISVLSFASFAWRLSTIRKESWEDDSKVSVFTKLFMGIASLLPIFCTVSIIPDFLVLPLFLWNDIWLFLLDYIFSISYSLFTALAIGSFLILFMNAGISEYEQTSMFDEKPKQKKYRGIKILEVILFGLFLYLDLNDYTIIQLFYYAGFGMILFTSFVNYIRGKTKYGSFKSHLVGYLIAAVFIGSNVLFSSAEISGILRVWSLLISAILYIFVLFYTFATIEE